MSVKFRSIHAVLIAALAAMLGWTLPALPAETDDGARILIAHPQLQDALYGSTILFAKPMPDGSSLGFILNKPTPVTLGQLFPRDGPSQKVIEPVFRDEPVRPDADTRVYVNPEGPFEIGGPSVHAGLTGRKNAIDTYGEYARHSGAALSGKDPSRIDRTGAYAARYAAKNVVAAGLADECEVLLSYAIGQARPVSVQVETFGTGRVSDTEIGARLEAQFDFRPAAIVRAFNLRQLPTLTKGGFYRRLAAYGHVGRMDIGLPWERTDKTAVLGSV